VMETVRFKSELDLAVCSPLGPTEKRKSWRLTSNAEMLSALFASQQNCLPWA